MTQLIRFIRFAFKYVLGLALVLLLLLALVVGLVGFTPIGSGVVASRVAALVSRPGQEVSIGTPSGLLTGALRVPEITLSDSKGVYARIKDVAIDWSPKALVSGVFKASNISAARLEVYRPSADAPPPADPNAPPFKLPVSVDVDHVELPDVFIGKAVAGRDFELAASGAGRADNTNIIVNLLANRKDLPEAKATADIAFVPGENRLTVKASVDEPRDGLLAGVLKLPGRPAMHLTVDGKGPLSDWAGAMTAELDGNRAFTAEARHQAVADNGHRIVLKGEGPAQPLMPATVRDLFPGNTSFAFDATLGVGGKIAIQSGTLSTDAVTLDIAGTYDPSGANDLTAHASGTSGPVEFKIPVGTETARVLVQSLDLALKGQAADAALDMSGKLALLELPGYRLDSVAFKGSSPSLNLQTRTGQADLVASFETGTFINENLQRLLPGPFTLHAPLTLSPEAITFNKATIESASLGGTLDGSYTLANGVVQSDLSIFALPSVLPDAVAARLKDKLSLAGSLSYTPGGAITLSKARLESDLLNASGEASLSDGQIRADLQGTLPRLDGLLADAKGAARFTVSASGAASAPDFKASLDADEAVLSGRKLESLALTAEGKADPKAPSATVRASGSLGGQVVTVDADLTSEDGRTSLPVLKADIGPNHLEGALTFTPEFLPTGELTFNLPDIGLVAALAGEKASGDLKGNAHFAADNGTASARITASGKGIQRGDLLIRNPEVALDVADMKTLAASGVVQADEVASGANKLTGLSLTFARQGPETGFDLKANYDGKPVAAKGGVTVAGPRTTVRLASASATPRGIALKLAAPTSVVIENGAVILDAKLDVGSALSTDAVTLDIAGTYDPSGANDLTAHASGTSGPVEFKIPVGTETARVLVQSLDLALKGQAADAALDMSGKLALLELPGYRLDSVAFKGSSPSLNLQTRTGQADLVASFETGTFINENLQRLLPGPFTLHAPLTLSPEAITFNKATIESASLGGTLDGSYTLANGVVQSDLSIFALPSVLPDAVAARLKDKLSLAGSLSYTPGGAITFSKARLESDILNASGEASLSDGQIRADLQGTLPRLDGLLADAKGAARFTVSASGAASAPDFKASLDADEAVLSGRKLESLALTAEGKADPKAPSATVRASGSLGGQVVTVDADLTSEDGRTSLPVLKADIGPNHLEGALTFTPEFLPTGELTFNLPDIGLVAALAGEKASGDLKGNARFAADNGTASARITASGKGIQRGDLLIRNPEVALDVADMKTLAASGVVQADEVASGANKLTGLSLTFARQGPETGFDLKANYDGKPVAAKGGVTVAGPRTTVRLASASATPRGIALKLAAPTSVVLENGSVTIPKTVIQTGKGAVTVSGAAGSTLKIAADINSLPLSLANTFMPSLGAEGSLSGTVNVSGSTARPVVDYRISLDRAAVAQSKAAGLQAFSIKADGRLENNQLRLNTTASNGDGLSVKGGGGVALSGNKALNLSFSGNLPFKALAAQLAAQGLELSGTAALDVKIGGTTAAPVITGKVSSSNAQLIDVRHNIALRNVALSIDIDRNRANIGKLTGTLSTGGTISATGSVGTSSGSNFPADIKIALNKAAYVDGKVVSTVIDGNLTLTGPLLAGPKLGGSLTLGRSAITIPQKLPASLASINVKHRNESGAVARQAADVNSRGGKSKGSSSSSIALDLTISAPRIFVQGRGIDAELGGDLTLRGTAAAPEVSGGFKMKRGRLTILNRRLDFTEGTITFGGDLTPTLAMAAEAASGSATVTVSVDGPANDPNITFSSNPVLPQDEVLAQLIFQQSLSRLSVLQIAQLADAAAQLAGGRSTSLLQGLRSNLGIDDLDITSDENGQAQVKAGKYLNDKTYIQFEQGGSSGGKASINLDVGRGVKLKGEAGEGGGAAGIFYEKEY